MFASMAQIVCFFSFVQVAAFPPSTPRVVQLAVIAARPGEVDVVSRPPRAGASWQFAQGVRSAVATGGRVVSADIVYGDNEDHGETLRIIVAKSRLSWAYELEFTDGGDGTGAYRRLPTIPRVRESESFDASALMEALKSAEPKALQSECGETYVVIGEEFVSLEDPSWSYPGSEDSVEGDDESGDDENAVEYGSEEQDEYGREDYSDSGCGC